MIKIIKILFYCSIVSLPILTPIQLIYAQSPTTDKIELIKEKVASKVAQLDKTLEFAADGTITKLEEGIFSFSTNGQEKTITTDANPRILIRDNKLNQKQAEFDDLEQKDTVTVIGNEQLGTGKVEAKLIVKESAQTVFFTGKIEKLNKNNFSFTISEEKEEYIFDYEKHTKSYVYSRENKKLKEGGFSSLEEGKLVQILAVPTENSQNAFTSLRLILIQ